MIISLIEKNKRCFVDGSVAKSSSTSSDSKSWERCNNMIIGWIIASPDRVIAKSVMYYNTAHEIWNYLEERFEKSSSAQLYSLQKELTNIIQTSSMIELTILLG